jgi:type IV pilus assembly protein PilE
MRQNTKNGFTLIELMIALAVLSILTAIAYPTFQESMIKSRRADAKSALLELSVSMERLYTATGCYNSGVDKTCGTSDDGAPTARTTPPLLAFDVAPKSAFNPNVAASAVKANYDLTVCVTGSTASPCDTVTIPTAGFVLIAKARQTNAPDKCDTLNLNNTGTKGVVNNNGYTVADCW